MPVSTGGTTTATITANAQRRTFDVAGFTAAVVTISGTYNGVNLTFEVSDDNGTTYFPVAVVRQDTLAQELTSGVLTNTDRAWTVPVGGFNLLSVRSAAWVSGTATLRATPTDEADALLSAATSSVTLGAGTNNIGDVDVASIAAGETHLGQVGGHTTITNVTFTLDTSAYASGDVLADTQEISNCLRVTDGTGLLVALTLVDQDDNGAALYVVILGSNVAFGTENAAPSITDADALHILAIVPVATTDYLDVGGAKVAQLRNLNIPVKAASGTNDLFVALWNQTGTPTYTASGIVGRFAILAD